MLKWSVIDELHHMHGKGRGFLNGQFSENLYTFLTERPRHIENGAKVKGSPYKPNALSCVLPQSLLYVSTLMNTLSRYLAD